MTFRCQDKVGRKLGVAPQGSDTGDDVAEESRIGMTGELDRMVFERGTTGELVVDDVVEFLSVLERLDA